MPRPVAWLLLGCLVFAACEGGSSTDSARPAASPVPSAAAPDALESPAADEPGERSPSEPRKGKIVYHRVGDLEPRLRRAIADLKRIGEWRRLTGHLYQIDLSVRTGRKNVPNDRHLADARFWRVRYGEGDRLLAIFCWVRFYPAAIQDDLARWRSLYSQGMTTRVPPTVRQLWAGILGHELYHCPARGRKTRPEAAALAREQHILGELVAAGIE